MGHSTKFARARLARLDVVLSIEFHLVAGSQLTTAVHFGDMEKDLLVFFTGEIDETKLEANVQHTRRFASHPVEDIYLSFDNVNLAFAHFVLEDNVNRTCRLITANSNRKGHCIVRQKYDAFLLHASDAVRIEFALSTVVGHLLDAPE